MHAYRILLPSETDDSRFNSCEKHMLTDLVQPYNKSIIDLAWTSLLRRLVHTKKPRSDISQYRPQARSISLYYHRCCSAFGKIFIICGWSKCPARLKSDWSTNPFGGSPTWSPTVDRPLF